MEARNVNEVNDSDELETRSVNVEATLVISIS
jgi:hypothetical protein